MRDDPDTYRHGERQPARGRRGELARRCALAVLGLLLVGCGQSGGTSTRDRSHSQSTIETRSWTVNDVPSDVGSLEGISCSGTSDCWAVGTNSTGLSAVVIVTTNGGQSWRSQKVPSSILSLDSVTCPSTSDCWAEGTVPASGQTGGAFPLTDAIVIATRDAGVTWKTEAVPVPRGVSLEAITCPNTENCWAVGGFASGVVIATANGGVTWRAEVLPSNTYQLVDVACASGSRCWAVVGVNLSRIGVVSTDDEGLIWRSQTLPDPTAQFYGVSCPETNDCWAITGQGSSDAGMLATQDGGRTWATQKLPSGLGSLQSISCPRASVCAAVGYEYRKQHQPSIGTAVTTSNGGKNWIAQSLPAGTTSLNAVTCAGSGPCWVTAVLKGRPVILRNSVGA